MTLTSNPAPGNPRRVLLAGATGLVGSALERRLRAAHWPLARLLRGPLPDHADAGDLRLPAAPAAADGDAAFVAGLQAFRPAVLVSALGTTLRRAGSREAFRAIDYELNLRIARAARAAGARHCVLVSSVDADPASSNFYLRVKGELEQALVAAGFARVDLLQPSLLLGPRAERRPAEALGQRLAGLVAPLLRGRLRRYRAIAADAVAAAILALLAEDAPGVYRHQHDAIVTAARSIVQ